jgi:hypothetical protein
MRFFSFLVSIVEGTERDFCSAAAVDMTNFFCKLKEKLWFAQRRKGRQAQSTL